MRRLMLSPPGLKTNFFLPSFQVEWLERSMAASQRRERMLEAKTLELITSDFGKHDRFSAGPRWPKPSVERAAPDLNADLEVEVDDALPIDFNRLANSFVRDGESTQSCEGVPVLTSEDLIMWLLPPNGNVLILPSGAGARTSIDPDLLRPVSALKPGMVFAPITGEHKVILEEVADQFLENAAGVHRLANMWRAPFQSAVERENDWRKLIANLARAGVKRHPQTFRNWAEDASVAPRNYSSVVRIIAETSGDSELKLNVDGVVDSIRRLYKARAAANRRLLEEFYSGRFDPDAMILKTSVNGHQRELKLFTAAAIGEKISCYRADLNQPTKLESLRLQGSDIGIQP